MDHKFKNKFVSYFVVEIGNYNSINYFIVYILEFKLTYHTVY